MISYLNRGNVDPVGEDASLSGFIVLGKVFLLTLSLSWKLKISETFALLCPVIFCVLLLQLIKMMHCNETYA